MIITETEITVAATESRIINRENDFCWLKAMRRAIKFDRFTIKSYSTAVLNKPIEATQRLSVVTAHGLKCSASFEKAYF